LAAVSPGGSCGADATGGASADPDDAALVDEPGDDDGLEPELPPPQARIAARQQADVASKGRWRMRRAPRGKVR